MPQTFHPVVWWIWAVCTAVALAKQSSLLLDLAVVLLFALVVYRKSEDAPWARSFMWSLKIGVFVILIRVFFGVVIGVPTVGHSIFSLPTIPLPSWMAGIRVGGAITSERLLSTLHEGIMLATILAVLAAAASLTNPHRLLRSLPVIIYEFGVAVVIATSVFPQIAVSSKRIRDAHILRGHEFRGLREWRRFVLPLLEDSLSRSLDLAASMDARGYGVSRKRTKYRVTKWKAGEYTLILLSSVSTAYPVLVYISAALPLLVAPKMKATATR